MTAKRTRHNGEGSIFPYRNGFAAYVWVNKPDGTRDRKYVYGKDRETVHEKWLKLQVRAKEGPVATKAMTVGKFAKYWLEEVVRPNLSPGTYSTYESAMRLHIIPGLGSRRLDRLSVVDAQTWLNTVSRICQCCGQHKDAKRPPAKQRCCAVGRCCGQKLGQSSVRGLKRALRAMLSAAMESDMITKNVARQTRLPSTRTPRRRAWTSAEAKQFLEHARTGELRLYAAFVLTLVLGLRLGEVLGLTWERVDLDNETIAIQLQLQRVGRQLLHRELKSEASEATLPLPAIVVRVLKALAALTAERTGEAPSGFVFTTRTGMPIDPRNLGRFRDKAIKEAGVPRIAFRDARRTCATLLRDLNVHPRVAMAILRHARIAITMEVYTEVTDEATREALRKLGDSLGE